jgi:hypothetical protein
MRRRIVLLKRAGGAAAAVLLAGALAAGGASGVKKPTKTTAAKPAPSEAVQPDRRLIVYYFHGDARCFTCMKFERLTKEVLDNRFREEMKKGRVEFLPVNVDQDGNGHFIDDYQLYSKAVVLSEREKGAQTRWKNLDRIWEEVRNEAGFRKYIEDEVRDFLGT